MTFSSKFSGLSSVNPFQSSFYPSKTSKKSTSSRMNTTKTAIVPPPLLWNYTNLMTLKFSFMTIIIWMVTSQLFIIRTVNGQDDLIDLYPLANDMSNMQPMEPEPDENGDLPPEPLIPKRAEANGPRDCAELKDEDGTRQSGVYTIYPPLCDMCYYHVYCDMETDGGGWTLIMRRFNGSTDFYRGNYFYKMGFGDLRNEFYMGNDRISQLTNLKPNELMICITDVGDVQSKAGYSHFVVGKQETGYRLHVDSFWGDAGDYLSTGNGSSFSTFDNDNDGTPSVNCAKYFHSAWWYHTCGAQSNLFGYYFLGKQELPHFAGPGLSWRPVPGPGGPAIKNVLMKIRPMGYIGGTKDGGLGGDFGGGGDFGDGGRTLRRQKRNKRQAPNYIEEHREDL